MTELYTLEGDTVYLNPTDGREREPMLKVFEGFDGRAVVKTLNEFKAND